MPCRTAAERIALRSRTCHGAGTDRMTDRTTCLDKAGAGGSLPLFAGTCCRRSTRLPASRVRVSGAKNHAPEITDISRGQGIDRKCVLPEEKYRRGRK